MGIQVKTLFEQTKEKYGLNLEGGENGLSNAASWVYLAEDIQNISFLKGGELIVTTGLFVQSGVTLYEFIRTFATCNCSGILVNLGKYLRAGDITPKIKKFCDDNRIPLLTMPWEIHLIDIMQDYCGLLLSVSHRDASLSAALQNAIYQIPVPEGILRLINQFGFPTAADYRIVLIRNPEDPTRIASPLNRYELKYHLFPYDNLQILLYLETPGSLPLPEIVRQLCYSDSITLGVSDALHSLSELGVFYRHARFALAAAEFWQKPCVLFEEMGLFQLLFCTSEPGLLETLCRKYLGPLEAYDMEHDTDYMTTLREYLLSDCNLLATASRMYAHRNTIVYRMRKIRDLLHSGIDSAPVKFNLMMAFYIREYLSM